MARAPENAGEPRYKTLGDDVFQTLIPAARYIPSSFPSAHNMSKRILTILGATGKQGGSVVNSILGDAAASSKFSVRAVTRDVTKDSAKALAAKGAEVVSVSP